MVEPDSSVRNATDVATVLRYEVVLVPHWSIPSTIMSCVVKAGLPANLIAVAQQAEQVSCFMHWQLLACSLASTKGVDCCRQHLQPILFSSMSQAVACPAKHHRFSWQAQSLSSFSPAAMLQFLCIPGAFLCCNCT